VRLHRLKIRVEELKVQPVIKMVKNRVEAAWKEAIGLEHTMALIPPADTNDAVA